MVMKQNPIRIALSGFIVLYAAFSLHAQQSISTEETESATTVGCNPPCPPDEYCDNGNCVRSQAGAGSEVQENRQPIDAEAPSHEKRKNGILFETPWNGLVGLGILYTIRPVWPMAIDGGIGLSSMGLKYGIRGRYCFINKNLTPFFGLGYMQASGADNVETSITTNYNTTTITYDLKPIGFIQITGGLDIVTSFGLTFVIATGWASPLNDGLRNVKYNGVPESAFRSYYDSDPQAVSTFKSTADLLYRGGLVLSFGIGYSF